MRRSKVCIRLRAGRKQKTCVEDMDQQGAGQRHSGRKDEVDEGVTFRGSEESKRSSVDRGFGRRTKNNRDRNSKLLRGNTDRI